MLKKFHYKDIVWIDVESPTPQELEELNKSFDLHPLVLNELVRPSMRSKVDLYSDFIYLILHFPAHQLRSPDEAYSPDRDSQEVDFIIGKKFIITTHYEAVNPLHDFSKIFETDFMAKKGSRELHAGYVFFYIMREIYGTIELSLRSINDKLKGVEARVFSGQERQVVTTLNEVNHELLGCRWNLKAHKEVLSSLEIAGTEMFGEKFRYYLHAINGDHEKIWQMIESIRENFVDLRNTTDSILAIKSNEIMKVLTVAAFIVLPMTIIPQLFGMSLAVPFSEYGGGFVIVVGLTLFSSVILYVIAKTKKWF